MVDCYPSSAGVSAPDSPLNSAHGAAKLPKHVAIIMDGNNRWAKAKGLPSLAGHRAGARKLRKVVQLCAESNIEVLTVFAFSSENWRRPQEEVSGLMQLFIESLDKELPQLHKHNICVRFIGDLSGFSADLVVRMQHATQLTANNQAMTLVVAVNYGGRWDMAQAARQAAVALADTQGQVSVANLQTIDERMIQPFMSLADLPELDLCIRTGYEKRLSNFLLWQAAYAELYFADCFWPDFGVRELTKALQHFAYCQRRFGRTSEQLVEQI